MTLYKNNSKFVPVKLRLGGSSGQYENENSVASWAVIRLQRVNSLFETGIHCVDKIF